MSEDVQRMMLRSQADPVETDAPEETPVAYDPGLLVELETHGPDAMQEYGQIVVRNTADPSRYNAALWYAMAYGLHAEHKGDVTVITDPNA